MSAVRNRDVGFATGNAVSGTPPAVVLGIDPGLVRTGYAVLRRTRSGPQLLEGGFLSSTPSLTLAERVLEIGQGMQEILREFRPESVAIEQIFSMPRNPKSALLMAHARGAILLTIAAAGLPILHYSPRQMKKLLTGSGTASKLQVQQAVQRELRLSQPLEPFDVADACAIAISHYHSCLFPAERSAG